MASEETTVNMASEENTVNIASEDNSNIWQVKTTVKYSK